jgi:hypothetical protein
LILSHNRSLNSPIVNIILSKMGIFSSTPEPTLTEKNLPDQQGKVSNEAATSLSTN